MGPVRNVGYDPTWVFDDDVLIRLSLDLVLEGGKQKRHFQPHRNSTGISR